MMDTIAQLSRKISPQISRRQNTQARASRAKHLSQCILASFILATSSNVVIAADTPEPASVTIPGSLQLSQGCPDNWQPACTSTYLEFLEPANVWKGTFDLPAGSYEYKAALNDSWDENYGANGNRNGSNIVLTVDADSSVNFYYDHQTNWVTDSLNSRIAIAAGSFQEYFGCSGAWQPDCLNSWLKDVDGDGIYTIKTDNIPAGDYQGKLTINQSWDENYGVGGVPNGANINFTVPADNTEMFFSFDSQSNILSVTADGEPNGNLGNSRAQWLDANTLAWDTPIESTDRVFLHASSSAELALSADGVRGGNGSDESYELSIDGALSAELEAKFPLTQGYTSIGLLGLADELKRSLVKSQLAVSVVGLDGKLKDATSIQMPGALDSLFYYDQQLGSVVSEEGISAYVWAPTAQNVELLLFDNSEQESPSQLIAMAEDRQTGVWSALDVGDWDRKFYRYRVTVYTSITGQVEVNDVTDPNSLSLSTNSKFSQFVNLDDADLKPQGWGYAYKPHLRAPEDISIYELHVRDFSINDETVAEQDRGTFNAFASRNSNGMRHLSRLSRSGLSHIHLLPVFDIASVNEDKSQQLTIEQDLSLLPADSELQQAAVAAVQNQDGFNWGYDPYHFTVPEGSYSSNPEGVTRIREFRNMVLSLNHRGLRVIMDVVYNHTSSFGQFENSVLDRIVPNYYHRYNADGGLETSSCCANTASENRMMEKLMIDSLLVWAKAYKVDGFRFDLMGHHSKQNMLKVQAELAALTLRKDGVDGRAIYLYGEGWNFGEVVDNARFEQATQLNMAGSGIGSFDDRGRDAIRGGNPFGGYRDQGFGNGLFTNPNGFGDDRESTLLELADRTRSSLAGGLKDFVFETKDGEVLTAFDIDYFGLPTGYTDDPQEQIAYIAAHDNETLLDGLQLKAPESATIAERARMQNFSSSLVMLGQGVPFIHAGQDFLRSKSLDRDSFNSGDWVNAIDFTFEDSGWGKGLPIAEKNEDKWPTMAPLLANPDLDPSRWLMAKSSIYFRELLRIRYSSSLYRLRDKQSVIDNMTFLNTGITQTSGLIVMHLKDEESRRHKEQVVFFNGSNQPVEFSHEELDADYYRLHPVQRWSIDADTRASNYQAGTFTVPAMTTAVFIGKKRHHYWNFWSFFGRR
jgi:pullulanase